MDYSIKLFKYRLSGVREYWIVDPDKNRIMAYCFETEEDSMEEYSLSEKVKVNIYDDLEIDFATIDIQ